MPRQPAFTPEELTAISRVWNRFPHRDCALFSLMQNSGLRISEALRITVGDVWDGTTVRPVLVVARRNLKHGRGVYRKSIRSRVIPLNAIVQPVLREYLIAEGLTEGDRQRPLFVSRNRAPLSRRQATWRLRQILEAAGLVRIGYGWHAARRTFAEDIYRVTGHDIVLTSRVLGHASLEVTGAYLSATDQAANAAVLALGSQSGRAAELRRAQAAVQTDGQFLTGLV